MLLAYMRYICTEYTFIKFIIVYPKMLAADNISQLENFLYIYGFEIDYSYFYFFSYTLQHPSHIYCMLYNA